jgi:hypothetical protein
MHVAPTLTSEFGLKQTLEASYDPGPLLLEGPNGKLSTWLEKDWLEKDC